MRIRILKESKLLQENVEVIVNASEEDQKASKEASKKGNAKYFFTVQTDNIKVKQVLTIKKTLPGRAKLVFEGQLSKVQNCFPKPPEMTYQGDVLDPIHQIQVDNGYVVQTPQYTTNTMGQKIYSHDDNHWILADNARENINVWSISFEIVEINDADLVAYGQEFSTNPFNSLRASYAFFRKLTELVGEFVAKNPYRFYYFHGITEQGERDTEASKRTQLYKTMLKKMYKVLGGNWVQFEETYDGEPDPNFIFFFKCPGGPVTESRKRKFYLTTKDKKLIQEAYNKEIENFLIEKCQKGYKTHKTRKTKIMFGKRYRNCVKAEEGKDPKKRTGKKPKGSGRRLYTDEDPSDTVSVSFKSVSAIKKTLAKKSFKSKSHKRQSQIINLIHQRSRAAYKNAKDPEVKARLKKAFKYAEKRKEASKKKTIRMRKKKK
jgi:hypothetical protein